MKKKIILNLAILILLFLCMGVVSYCEESKMTLEQTLPAAVPAETETLEEQTIANEKLIKDFSKKIFHTCDDLLEITIGPTPVPLNLDYDNYDTEQPEYGGQSILDTSNPSGLKRILETITWLVIVCLLAIVFIKIFYAKGAGIVPQPKKNLLVLEKVQLQPQKNLILSLVKAGDKVLLISATDKEISLLKEFEMNDFPSIAKRFSKEQSGADFKAELSSKLENPDIYSEKSTFLSRLLLNLGFAGYASLFTIKEKNISNKKDGGD